MRADWNLGEDQDREISTLFAALRIIRARARPAEASAPAPACALPHGPAPGLVSRRPRVLALPLASPTLACATGLRKRLADTAQSGAGRGGGKALDKQQAATHRRAYGFHATLFLITQQKKKSGKKGKTENGSAAACIASSGSIPLFGGWSLPLASRAWLAVRSSAKLLRCGMVIQPGGSQAKRKHDVTQALHWAMRGGAALGLRRKPRRWRGDLGGRAAIRVSPMEQPPSKPLYYRGTNLDTICVMEGD
ncbi:uncharacterized protein VTP21DRAFT_2136 [Calcarisporiella thermophila]|uniref:uncharacterized protein n=1 Tax=Calcarisporiella thermophila TaxID=911321 RepID=UPI003743C0CB